MQEEERKERGDFSRKEIQTISSHTRLSKVSSRRCDLLTFAKKGKLFFLGVKLHHKQVSLIPSRVSISSTSENQLFFLFRECIFGGILGYFTLSTFQFDPPPEFVLLLHIFEIPAANLGRRIRETTLMGFSELLRLKTSGARQNAHRISIVAFSFPVFLRRKN